MTAVLVILAAEQCGAFIEQRALQGRQPLGQPVDFLVDVRYPQVAHTPGLEFVLVLPALYLVVSLQVDASAHVLRQAGFQAQGLPEHVVALLQVEVSRPSPIHDDLLESLPAQQAVRNERARQCVTLEDQARLQVNTRFRGLRQAIQRDRRLVPAAVGPALQVVENLPAIEHRYRIAEGECHRRATPGFDQEFTFGGLQRGRLCLRAAHQKNSITPVLATVWPSSGSLCNA
ncbi:hypothetical protein D3C73_918550 [compost metagenome]